MMQRMEWSGGLCHGEQKANSHNSAKNGLKMFVVVVDTAKCVIISHRRWEKLHNLSCVIPCALWRWDISHWGRNLIPIEHSWENSVTSLMRQVGSWLLFALPKPEFGRPIAANWLNRSIMTMQLVAHRLHYIHCCPLCIADLAALLEPLAFVRRHQHRPVSHFAPRLGCVGDLQSTLLVAAHSFQQRSLLRSTRQVLSGLVAGRGRQPVRRIRLRNQSLAAWLRMAPSA